MTQTTDHQTEAEEARALVDTLLERVRNGDESVTPEEVDGARKLAEFAQLRIEAAERKAWAAGSEAAAAEQAAAADELKSVLSVTPKNIEALEQKAAKAFEALMTAVDERYATVFRASRRLRLANNEAAKWDLPDAGEAHGVRYDVGQSRFRWTNERGSQSSADWADLSDAQRWVDAVIKPSQLQFPRGTKVHSARRPERLLADTTAETD